MHVPPRLLGLMPPSPVHEAVNNSCAVYGELDPNDPTTSENVSKCMSSYDLLRVAGLPPHAQQLYRDAITATLSGLPANFSVNGVGVMQRSFLAEQLELDPIINLQLLLGIGSIPDATGSDVLSSLLGVSLDSHLLGWAHLRGIATGGLEAIQSGCDIMLQLDGRQRALNASQWDAEFEDITTMKKAHAEYVCGEKVQNSVLMGPIFGPEEKALQSALLTTRNIKMTARIDELLSNASCPVTFVVGLLHFIGQDNLVELLARRGYTLQRIESIWPPPPPPSLSPPPQPPWTPPSAPPRVPPPVPPPMPPSMPPPMPQLVLPPLPPFMPPAAPMPAAPLRAPPSSSPLWFLWIVTLVALLASLAFVRSCRRLRGRVRVRVHAPSARDRPLDAQEGGFDMGPNEAALSAGGTSTNL